MKDYYQILGVDRKANSAEIKRAFRRLAIAYHPDHNPSKDAESIIKEVIEAYEVLDDPDKKMLYDSLWVDRVALAEAERLRQRQNQQSPFGRPGPAYYHKSEREEMLDFMFANVRYAIYVSWITLLFCFFLSLDFFLPIKQQTEVIKESKHDIYSRAQGRFETDKGQYKLKLEDALRFKEGQEIMVSYSRILSVPRSFRALRNPDVITVPATIYGNFSFLPILLLIGSVLGVTYKKGFVFRFNIAIVNFLLALLTVLFLFIHHLKI